MSVAYVQFLAIKMNWIITWEYSLKILNEIKAVPVNYLLNGTSFILLI